MTAIPEPAGTAMRTDRVHVPAALARAWPALLLVALLVAAAPVASQRPAPVRELDAAARNENGVALRLQKGVGKERRVVMVEWGEIEVPLETPVRECAVGLVSGGRELVVLAGGVRSSLDLYLVQSDGAFQHYATDGGRRLPRKFNHGAGSWPIVEGRHLLFFGFEKRTGIEFRALDFTGRVHLERRVPGTVTGFAITSDPDGGEVRVNFGTGVKPSVFRHPLAPWLELSRWGLIQFGKVDVGSHSRQLLELTNRGRRPLKLKVELARTGFAIKSKVPVGLAPGETHRMRIEFAPDRGGMFDVGLKFIANGVVAEHTVRLRGEGIVAHRRIENAGDGARTAPEPPPSAPVVRTIGFYPRGGARTLVLGRVRAPLPARVAIRSGAAAATVVAVDAQGRFHATLDTSLGGEVRVCAVSRSGKRSLDTRLGTVPRLLTVDARSVTVRCLPAEEFLLTVRDARGVLKRWLGKADAGGRCRVPLSSFGKRKKGGPILTVEVTLRDADGVRSSARLRLR